MDIGKDKKIELTGDFMTSPSHNNVYIPALHSDNKDTVELGSLKEKQQKNPVDSIVGKLKKLTNISFGAGKSDDVSSMQEVKKTTKEDVLAKLAEVELPENLKEMLANGVQTQEQIDVADKLLSDSKLYQNKNIQRNMAGIFSFLENPESAQVKVNIMDKYLSDPRLYENKNLQKNIGNIIGNVESKESEQSKLALIDKLLSEPKYSENKILQENIGNILVLTDTSESVQLKIGYIDKIILEPEKFESKEIQGLVENIFLFANTPEKADIANKILSDARLYENKGIQKHLGEIFQNIKTPENAQAKLIVIEKYLSNPKLYEDEVLQEKLIEILVNTKFIEDAQAKSTMMDKYLSDPKYNESKIIQEEIGNIILWTFSQDNVQAKTSIIDRFLSNPELYENQSIQENFGSIIKSINTNEKAEVKRNILDRYLSDSKQQENPKIRENIGIIVAISSVTEQAALAEKFLLEPLLYENTELKEEMADIISDANTQERAQVKIDIIDRLLSDSTLYYNEWIQENLSEILCWADTQKSKDIIIKFLSDPKLYENEGLRKNISYIIYNTYTPESLEARFSIIDKFLETPELHENEIIQKSLGDILCETNTNEKAILAQKFLPSLTTGETTPEVLLSALKNYGKVSYQQLQKLEKTVGHEFFSKISQNPTDLLSAANLIGLYGKNNINEIPIAEKRNVLRTIVKNNTDLFGISDDLKQTFPLIPTNREEYCALLPALVKSLGIEVKTLETKQVEEFNESLGNLSSSLSELSNDEFDNLVITQLYSKDEFIKDTLSIVKGLSKVEKQKVYDYFGFELHHNRKAPTGYSITGYPVNINNGKKLAQITDKNTKQVVEKLREKVVAFSENNPIQSNNPVISQQLSDILEFLPELRSSIGRMQYGAHEFDVIKHSLKVMQKIAQNPSFEKLNPSDKKIMMLSALLHDISKAEVVSDPLHNFESSFDAYYIAKKFNLTQDEQIKMYTLINHHEWLKYVNKQGLSEEELTKRLQSVAFDFQNDNLFEMAKIFTEADIKSITKGDGLYDKFGDALKIHSKEVEEYIAELKKSKPILPTTKLPKASEIASKITNINADCSTNIKGVYVKDGLVVVRYNEVEDWEKLGFPQGSISRGIETINPVDNTQINTGNIKFIAHGLEYENQLSNFDAFALPDSDALLSVSYMERPESKYRLFRPQGVLLDVDSKYIHGGGETDSGSGYGKNIDEFKLNYIFGGERQCDRDYISDLIKETLGFNDEEYVSFIQKNQNKSMLEIEPVEAREALIKKFALINSNTRRGNREYNEMYVSNPKVQGCFAYSTKDYIGDTIQFVDAQQEFLKDYAKENDLPFFVFGN